MTSTRRRRHRGGPYPAPRAPGAPIGPARGRPPQRARRCRRSPSPRVARRVSGPAAGARRPAPRTAGFGGGAIAAPPLGLRVARGVATLPDHRVVDALVRGRWWIGCVGFLLIGIVAMQVSLLKLNAGIGESVQRSALLERNNGELRASVSRLGARERIQAEAERIGLVMPGRRRRALPRTGRRTGRAAGRPRRCARARSALRRDGRRWPAAPADPRAPATPGDARDGRDRSTDGTSTDGTATDGTVDGLRPSTDGTATDGTSTDRRTAADAASIDPSDRRPVTPRPTSPPGAWRSG